MAETDYIVLKEADAEAATKALDAGQRVWVEVGTASAGTNNDAIVAATEEMSEEEKGGNYAAPAKRNFPVVPRNRMTKVVDEFGAPSTQGTRRPRKAKEPATA